MRNVYFLHLYGLGDVVVLPFGVARAVRLTATFISTVESTPRMNAWNSLDLGTVPSLKLRLRLQLFALDSLL